MSVRVSEVINASRESIWQLVTDIDNAHENISAIIKTKVLERSATGIVGTKWEETRLMFGKQATETMWISSAKEPEWYETTAHNCGCVYLTRIELEEAAEGIKVSMEFSSKPQSFWAKCMAPMGLLFKPMIRKAFIKDLEDLKSKAEGR